MILRPTPLAKEERVTVTAKKKQEIVYNEDGLFIPTEKIGDVRSAIGAKAFDKAVKEAGLNPKELQNPGYFDIIADSWGGGLQGKLAAGCIVVGGVTVTLFVVEGGFRLAGAEGPVSWLAHKLVG